jgi:flagellar hook-associated protein 1 FlgK
MSSIGGILSAAARALVTHQKAMAVTTHNISNAETEGYSRQRAVLGASDPLITPDGIIGTGVELKDIERIREPLLDDIYRGETSTASFHGERADQLGRIEQVFGEPSDTGLMAALDAFWNAWSDLATDPLSDAARSVVRQRGMEVSDRLWQLSSGLSDIRTAGHDRVDALVSRTNELASHIASLNGRIVSAEAGGAQAGDLRDARDTALDELAELVDIQVVARDNGGIGVYLEGQSLVDGTSTRPLIREASGGSTVLRFEGRSTPIRAPGGKVGGLLSVIEDELTTAQSELDGLATDLVETVNSIHRSGVNPLGNTGVEFFDPAGTSASTIGLYSDGVVTDPDPDVGDDPGAIAAGRGAADGSYRAGANDIALAIEGLREDPAGSGVLAERYSELVARTGSKVASAESSAEVHQTLSHQADIRRESVSGVSVDEELTTMIRQQAAFGAAARIVGRADEMLQTLIGIA